jgi:hypothetical protein
MISSNALEDSGTATGDGDVPATPVPAPDDWPKWLRQALYPAGVTSVLRHTT